MLIPFCYPLWLEIKINRIVKNQEDQMSHNSYYYTFSKALNLPSHRLGPIQWKGKVYVPITFWGQLTTVRVLWSIFKREGGKTITNWHLFCELPHRPSIFMFLIIIKWLNMTPRAWRMIASWHENELQMKWKIKPY